MNKPIGPANIRYKPIPSKLPQMLFVLSIAFFVVVLVGTSTCEVNTYKNKDECLSVLISRMIEKNQTLTNTTINEIEKHCQRYK